MGHGTPGGRVDADGFVPRRKAALFEPALAPAQRPFFDLRRQLVERGPQHAVGAAGLVKKKDLRDALRRRRVLLDHR